MKALHHRVALVACLLASGACHRDTLGSPEVPEEIREQDPGPATAPAPQTAPAAAPDEASVDLTPHGLEATLRADGEVEASATPEGVRLRAGEDFDMIVARGSLDMTGEREELVREYGARFERFLIDSSEVVAWEISAPAGSTYHFFASFEGEPLSHHCRSAPEGTASPQLVDAMVRVCRSVQAKK
ncbi:MAG: hypothetical protein ACE37F_38185 [Nannocystaceae bacterium]|nr:hypothetical protein [bacterium]